MDKVFRQLHESKTAKAQAALQYLIDARYVLDALGGKWERHGDKVAKVIESVNRDIFASHIVKTGK